MASPYEGVRIRQSRATTVCSRTHLPIGRSDSHWTNLRGSGHLLCRQTQPVTYCARPIAPHGGLRRNRQSDGSRAQIVPGHPPGRSPAHRADPMANDRTPCARASTNRPAPAPSGSGGHPPTGPGTGGGARCRPIRPAPRSSDAPPGPPPGTRRAAPPAGSRRRDHRHSSAPPPAQARGHLPASSDQPSTVRHRPSPSVLFRAAAPKRDSPPPAGPRQDGPMVVAIVLCAWSHPGRCRSENASLSRIRYQVPRTLRGYLSRLTPWCGQASEGPYRHLDPCRGPGRAARSAVGTEADAWMQVDALIRWLVSARGGATLAQRRSRSAERERLTERQESVSLPPLRSSATCRNGA